MDEELLQTLQQYVDMSHEERTQLALQASNAILDLFQNTFEGDDVFDAYLQMYGVFCSVDGTLAREEFDLFINITGTDVEYDVFFDAVKSVLEETDIDELFEFINNQNEEIYGAFCMLAICIFTCDETFSQEELDFFEEYFLF